MHRDSLPASRPHGVAKGLTCVRRSDLGIAGRRVENVDHNLHGRDSSSKEEQGHKDQEAHQAKPLTLCLLKPREHSSEKKNKPGFFPGAGAAPRRGGAAALPPLSAQRPCLSAQAG